MLGCVVANDASIPISHMASSEPTSGLFVVEDAYAPYSADLTNKGSFLSATTKQGHSECSHYEERRLQAEIFISQGQDHVATDQTPTADGTSEPNEELPIDEELVRISDASVQMSANRPWSTVLNSRDPRRLTPYSFIYDNRPPGKKDSSSNPLFITSRIKLSRSRIFCTVRAPAHSIEWPWNVPFYT